METLAWVIVLGFVVFIALGILGAAFRWATSLIRTFVSIALFGVLALGLIYFLNGQALPL